MADAEVTEEERRRRVDAMRANFAQEGMHPNADHVVLLERYIKGTAGLADLLDHARQYAATAQLGARDDAVRAARATVVLDGGQPSAHVEEGTVRYVLGEIGIDEFLNLKIQRDGPDLDQTPNLQRKRMVSASKEDLRVYAGRVLLEAPTGADDAQDVCPEGYHVVIKRRDGIQMSEMELRSVITNLTWAIEGEVCHIDLERI